jgi:hypothetical protein
MACTQAANTRRSNHHSLRATATATRSVTGRLVVDVLDVQEEPDSAALSLTRCEAETHKDLIEHRTRDMDKLFAHDGQNVSHTSTIASALCAFVDRFRDLNLERGEGSSNPQVHRKQEALEHEAEDLYDILHGVVETSQPPQMRKRDE